MANLDAIASGENPVPAGTPAVEARVQAQVIDVAAEIAGLEGDGAAGALVTFTGYCRDEGGTLSKLEIEHYPGMAEREIARICAQAASRWPLLQCRAIHRYGLIKPGETIVFAACTSEHRAAAFEAASFIMDFLKTRAPFWKREHRTDGTEGEWVSAKDTDDSAADKWHRL